WRRLSYPRSAPTALHGLSRSSWCPFCPSGSRSAVRQEGTGLGLPISQRFAQIMGGQITIQSQIGVGAIFRVELPVIPMREAVMPAAQPQRRVIGLAPEQPTYQILVVEDQQANRQLLVRLLSLVGFQVQTATNGNEAIALCQRWQPQLICMDVRMAGIDGYETTRRIKQLYAEDPDNCPKIIAVTASAFEEERQTALAAGCDDFIRKPFQEAILFETLATHLNIRYQYQPLPIGTESQTATFSGTSEAQGKRFQIKAEIIEQIWEIADGDSSFLTEYLTEHLRHLPELMQSLQEAVIQENAADLSLAAHSLKGMGMTFGADSFVAHCLMIEQQANTNDTTVSPEQLQNLQADLDALIASIRAIFP
ncbi:MAG: response regulator, partial [Leptolyngbya sp. SIO1D8]|nr:response regulator [Leptolyngbya sp. SIO1D8]